MNFVVKLWSNSRLGRHAVAHRISCRFTARRGGALNSWREFESIEDIDRGLPHAEERTVYGCEPCGMANRYPRVPRD